MSDKNKKKNRKKNAAPAPALHFLYETDKEPGTSFARHLIEKLGQAAHENADTIVSVGGDGLLLKALRASPGKKVFGITPPGSNSRGFWTDHDVRDADGLLKAISKAQVVRLAPLRAEIRFAGGGSRTVRAFSDVAVERESGQSALIDLRASFTRAVLGPFRIMGDGFVFATALGSTGSTRSYGGPAIDIRNNVIIMTGKGIYHPRGIAPVVADAAGTVFSVDFVSATGKRPVRIDYDGLSVKKGEDGSPVTGLDVAADESAAVDFLVTKDPGIRTLAVLAPGP